MGYVQVPQYVPFGSDPLTMMLLAQQQQQRQQAQPQQGPFETTVKGVGTILDAYKSKAVPQVFSATAPEAAANAYTSSALGTKATAASSLPSLGSIVPPVGAAVGTYLGGKAAYDMLRGKKPGTAGRVTLGIATGGLSEVANSLFGSSNKWKTAGKEFDNLEKQGIKVPDWAKASLPTDHGRSKEELIAQNEAAGNTIGAAYAKDRDINLLKGHGEQVTWSPTFAEYDKDWFNKSREQQIAFANKLLDADLLKDEKGRFVFDFKKAAALK